MASIRVFCSFTNLKRKDSWGFIILLLLILGKKSSPHVNRPRWTPAVPMLLYAVRLCLPRKINKLIDKTKRTKKRLFYARQRSHPALLFPVVLTSKARHRVILVCCLLCVFLGPRRFRQFVNSCISHGGIQNITLLGVPCIPAGTQGHGRSFQTSFPVKQALYSPRGLVGSWYLCCETLARRFILQNDVNRRDPIGPDQTRFAFFFFCFFGWRAILNFKKTNHKHDGITKIASQA